MPTYQFEAMDETGKPIKSSVKASSSDDAIAQIRSKGLFPTSVREEKLKRSRSGSDSASPAGSAPRVAKKKSGGTKLSEISIGGVSKKQLTAFTRQFSTLQDAGLPILRSLQILEQQQKPGPFKNILRQVHEDVASGLTLSDSMSKHPKAFDKLYFKMIAAGEVGGVLDQILQRLAEFMEKAAKLKRRIIGAMIYPAVVIGVATVIVVGIMIMIVPKFEQIFSDFDTELPKITMVLVNTSSWIGGGLEGQIVPGWIWLICSPLFIFIFVKLGRKSTLGAKAIDRGSLLLPVAGKIISRSTIARFTRTLGTLIRAGVPILDALTITRETTGNVVFANALNRVYTSVQQGNSFAQPLGEAKVCDTMVVNMIGVGEETGELDSMLLRVADNYDEEVDVLVQSLTSLLEPIMVCSLGLIVGFIVIALFMPLVTLIQGVQ